MNSRLSLRTSFLFIALPIIAVLYMFAFNAYYVGFFNDDAFFILGARSLLQGAFLDLTRPGQGPLLSYMPGTSVLYLPIAFLWPSSLIAYQVWAILISVLTVGLAGLFLEEFLEESLFPAAFLLAALNPLMLSLSATVLSDVPYLLCTLLFFIGFYRWEKHLDQGRALLLASTAIAAFYFRPLGAILLVSFLIYLFTSGRSKSGLMVVALSVVTIGPFLLRNYHVRGYWLSYGEQFLSPYRLPISFNDHLKWFAQNESKYVVEFFGHTFFRSPFAAVKLIWEIPISLLLGVISLIGFLSGKRSWFSVVLKMYVVGYVIILGLWRVHSERYLLPLVPFGVLFLFLGLRRLAPRYSSEKLGWLAALVVLAFALEPALVICNSSLNQLNDRNTPPERSYGWIRTHSAPNEIFAVTAEGSFYLRTGRSCLQFPFYQDQAFVSQWCQVNGVRFIVVQNDSFVLKTREERMAESHALPRWQIPRGWMPVYRDQDEGTTIFRRS